MNAIETRITELASQEETDFLVLQEGTPDSRRALYLLIHPGDVVQKKDDLDSCDPDDAEAMFDYSQSCQETMGNELEGLDRDVWDVVVLHRISTDYTFCNDVDLDYGYADAVRAHYQDPSAGLLWGDDLEAAARHVIEQLDARYRPLVVIAGAWSHVDGGCVEIVGKQLEAAGVALRMSHGTCISPDASEQEWIPAAGKIPTDEITSFASLAPAAA